MNKRYLLLIVIILAVIIIGGILAWQSFQESISESESTNWKTYRNEERCFEIKYPGQWYAEDLIIDSFGGDKLSGGILSTFPDAHPFMEPDRWRNLKGENIHLTISILDESLTQGFPNFILSFKERYPTSLEKYIIGDIKVIKLIEPYRDWYLVNPKTQEIYVIRPTIFKDGKFIHNSPESIEYNNNEKLFEEIISTFQFLD